MSSLLQEVQEQGVPDETPVGTHHLLVAISGEKSNRFNCSILLVRITRCFELLLIGILHHRRLNAPNESLFEKISCLPDQWCKVGFW